MATKRKRAKRAHAGIFTIWHVDKMSKRGWRTIASWLARVAAHMVRHGDEYAPRFTARYIVK